MQDLFHNKTIFINDLLKGEKKDCPCCGRNAQIYQRRLHHTAAKKLIDLYRLGGDKDYVHTSRLVERGETSIGDFSKAKYWDLIHEAPADSGIKKTSGLWRLTEKGVSFVRGQVTIPRTVQIFDDRVFGFSGDLVSIQQCLASGGFNYQDLMEL